MMPALNADHLLSLRDVCIHLGKHTFGPFTLSIQTGERIAILGPSGAGKSTLLKLLARELTPASGQAVFCQRSLKEWSLVDLSQRRAILPQSHEVAFGLPVDLVIGLGRVARAYDPELKKIVRQSAELTCAAHLLERRFDTLSGGEKARVQMARVFAQLWDIEKGLLLVDEPLAALDPGLQISLMDAIYAFASQRGHAILAILHDINQALQGFDRLILIKQGMIAGDYPHNQITIPLLESLYDVRLVSAVTDTGETIVAPDLKQKIPA
ncbi:MAG TPA: ATP-binding cassette domain-containing protein [Methylophilus sp.]|uniref:ABC transporter ATP-binding protein n=1 Tax=Methylophilus sp. TaxID=29541 RepID=UPI002C43E7B5|nr:ATP-binding cassette domain-containing protein [Methylophilus sp.]HSH87000.1 ATP-binding cassette domain-containing protein [Methylophilus sp.]